LPSASVRFVVRDNINGRIGSVTAPVVVKKSDGTMPPVPEPAPDAEPDANQK